MHLVIVVTPKAENNVRMAFILLVYIPQKFYSTNSCVSVKGFTTTPFRHPELRDANVSAAS